MKNAALMIKEYTNKLYFFSASSELVSHAALFVPSLNAPPQQMAAHIQTTFLSRFEPITAMEPFIFWNCFMANNPFTYVVQS